MSPRQAFYALLDTQKYPIRHWEKAQENEAVRTPHSDGGENVSTPTYPKKLHDVVEALLDYGWSYMLNHGHDTGNSPYISVEARRGNQNVRITWHTRATGTYRLFSCMVNKRDVTLTKALEVVTA